MTESESEMLRYYIFSGTYGTMKNIVNKRMKTFSEKTEDVQISDIYGGEFFRLRSSINNIFRFSINIRF